MSDKINKETVAFLKGQDFMRLGQNINKGNWQSVVMSIRRMQANCRELELTVFDRHLLQLRDAAMHKEANACKQILAQMVVKRVALLKQAGQEQQSTCEKEI